MAEKKPSNKGTKRGRNATPASASKKLPLSYYEGQNKNRKIPRDKNGDIIPE